MRKTSILWRLKKVLRALQKSLRALICPLFCDNSLLEVDNRLLQICFLPSLANNANEIIHSLLYPKKQIINAYNITVETLNSKNKFH